MKAGRSLCELAAPAPVHTAGGGLRRSPRAGSPGSDTGRVLAAPSCPGSQAHSLSSVFLMVQAFAGSSCLSQLAWGQRGDNCGQGGRTGDPVALSTQRSCVEHS